MIGYVKIRLHRSFQGTIKTVTVRETASGEFYATLVVDNQPDRPQLAKTKQAVGIDLNIKNGETIVTSDGEIISKPDTNQLEFKLHKQQKKLAKRLIVAHKLKKTVWESMNYQEQRKRVAKTRAKIARIRKDWLHKVTWNLVNEYDSIHIEDLNVSGMVRNHHLAKHIVDSLFGEFRRQLTYKCSWYGKKLVLVDRKDITGITINGTDYYVPYNDGNNSSELLDDPINHYQNNHYDVDNDEITISFKKKDSPKTYEIGDFMPQDHLVYHNNN